MHETILDVIGFIIFVGIIFMIIKAGKMEDK